MCHSAKVEVALKTIFSNVRPCVRVFVRLFTFEVLFKRLFAPTSQSRMFKIVRDSEFSGKETVSDLKTFTKTGYKISVQKKKNWAKFAFTEQHFLVSVFLTPLNGLFSPTF